MDHILTNTIIIVIINITFIIIIIPATCFEGSTLKS